MKFNLRIDDLEVRKWSGVLPNCTESIESIDIVKWVKESIDVATWVKNKRINYNAFVLAIWKKVENEYVLEFVKERPFNLNVIEKDVFWKLAMWGQTLLNHPITMEGK